MHKLTIAQQAKALAAKEFSSEELVNHYIQRIEAHDEQLNSFVTFTPEQAIESAKQADVRNEQGGILNGVPIAIKDIFCTDGIKTSCASRMLDNFVAPYDATVVIKLNQAGAVSLGKTNMDEFAMGSSSESSYYGAVKNPWDTERVPGGSSGGSAAAVAARLAPASIGTDTGGSIRQPAALCGITGLKPTYGRVSRFGMIAYASSLDQGGPFGVTSEDCAYMLQAIAGHDARDSTSVDQPVPDYVAGLNQSVKGLRIGLPEEFFQEGLDPDIAEKIQQACDVLKSLGCEIKPISLPNAKLAIAAYYVIAPAECSSNLSRFDGVRYGYRCENPTSLEDMYLRSRSEGLGEEVKRRIMVGAYALSAGYYDAYYLKAQKIRRLISEDYRAAFNQVDAVLSPTTPTTAFKVNEKSDDPITMYLSDIYTIGVNLAGLPGISLPVGFQQNLPVGMQLVSNYFEEQTLLNLGYQYQLQTDHHLQMPKEFE
ncbi:MAG: Asp-tRNA(Asn)/Glu-tRNA(Gln) amidotransferase subunit GatA [Gammaproteobacteria bacterium]|nr:Asp-tRNA(Asn)/Glu-tRNA(Gln) amidotransferase subunit GatA [Gammaproteobacteria bacterium]